MAIRFVVVDKQTGGWLSSSDSLTHDPTAARLFKTKEHAEGNVQDGEKVVEVTVAIEIKARG